MNADTLKPADAHTCVNVKKTTACAGEGKTRGTMNKITPNTIGHTPGTNFLMFLWLETSACLLRLQTFVLLNSA